MFKNFEENLKKYKSIIGQGDVFIGANTKMNEYMIMNRIFGTLFPVHCDCWYNNDGELKFCDYMHPIIKKEGDEDGKSGKPNTVLSGSITILEGEDESEFNIVEDGDENAEDFEEQLRISVTNLIHNFGKYCVTIPTTPYTGYYMMLITDYGIIKFTVNESEDENMLYTKYIDIMLTSSDHTEPIKRFIQDNFNAIPSKKRDEQTYFLAIDNGNHFNLEEFKFKKVEGEIDDNYNDDLPYKRINELLSTDDSELLLFYGEPGTGKSSLIKKLMSDNVENPRKFVYMDSNMLISVSNGKLINFLSSARNSIIILEDCEKLLMRREDGNLFLNALLNFTDGIVGDTFKNKFICTFNCSLDKIDEALLRKGRLSLKYEFKPLALEKAKKLFPDATSDMTLAEIYNRSENDYSQQYKGKIGF